jgi:heme exporter protein D
VSLGLPEFGSCGAQEPFAWRAVRALGFVALAYALVVASIEGREAYLADRSNERARVETAEASRSVEGARRALRKDTDFSVATAGVESSPDRVLRDLESVLPEGVSLVTLKLDYTGEATARLELAVVAQGPEAYDRFLEALSKSPRFGDIRPGSESRPGLVRATVSATHQPKGGAR